MANLGNVGACPPVRRAISCAGRPPITLLRLLFLFVLLVRFKHPSSCTHSAPSAVLVTRSSLLPGVSVSAGVKSEPNPTGSEAEQVGQALAQLGGVPGLWHPVLLPKVLPVHKSAVVVRAKSPARFCFQLACVAVSIVLMALASLYNTQAGPAVLTGSQLLT